MKFPLISFSLAMLAAAGSVAAEDETRAYDASLSLGYVGTSGNTETETFNTEALIIYRATSWTHNLKFQALGSNKDGDTDAERYYLEDKSDYGLDGDSYLFGKITYSDDRFSGFDSQTSVSAGYGRYLVQRDNLKVQGYAGAGYRENEVTNGGSIGEAIFTLGEQLSWNISDASKLVQSLTSEVGEDSTITKFVLGLETNIIGNIATKVAFEARNTSTVPAGVEKTDTLTSVSLVYTF
ncbi:MAG: putative salt-induced outer membrane protein [Halieaceae bacterium]|jgi:putative salt-induced outer membrane protein